MTLEEFNAFCAGLPGATRVVQWGEAHVWKVGGKVFALARADAPELEAAVTFKCSPMAYELLKDEPGVRPAPYLASRGLKWVQRFSDGAWDDDALSDYLWASYRMVVAGLPKRLRLELEQGLA